MTKKSRKALKKKLGYAALSKFKSASSVPSSGAITKDDKASGDELLFETRKRKSNEKLILIVGPETFGCKLVRVFDSQEEEANLMHRVKAIPELEVEKIMAYQNERLDIIVFIIEDNANQKSLKEIDDALEFIIQHNILPLDHIDFLLAGKPSLKNKALKTDNFRFLQKYPILTMTTIFEDGWELDKEFTSHLKMFVQRPRSKINVF